MNLYRTSESGLVPVAALDADETDGLGRALLRGPGGELGGEDLQYLTRSVADGVGTALAADAEGAVVVVKAVDGEVESDVVTAALQDASDVATRSYDDLDDAFDGEETLQKSHADYFDRDPLDPDAFNADQRVRLLGPAFEAEALSLAEFLSRKELEVTPVRVDAFDGGDEEFLVRFGTAADDPAAPAASAPEGVDAASIDADGGTDAAGSSQRVAGESGSGTKQQAAEGTSVEDRESGEAADEETVPHSGEHPDTSEEPDVANAQSAGTDPDREASGGRETVEQSTENGADAEPSTEASDSRTDATQGDDEGDAGEQLDLQTLLETVSEGVQNRLVGTFQGDVDELVSVERGNELLIRPDHAAYAGGVLRYRLAPSAEGGVDYEVNIYGGSEAEKEQMRAVLREHEAAIEEELGYAVADRYDGFHGHDEFERFDEAVAAAIVDEFDRLIRFFHPRVMRSWRDGR